MVIETHGEIDVSTGVETIQMYIMLNDLQLLVTDMHNLCLFFSAHLGADEYRCLSPMVVRVTLDEARYVDIDIRQKQFHVYNHA